MPSINAFEFDEEIFSGSDAQLSCYVSRGDQPLTIWWTRNGVRISNDAATSVTMFNAKTSVLTLNEVDHHSDGEYRCIAENPAGQTSHSANLTVYGKDTNSGKIEPPKPTIFAPRPPSPCPQRLSLRVAEMLKNQIHDGLNSFNFNEP